MTGLVVIVNVALVAPPAIVTLGGTCAADVLLLCNVTTAPPAGAAPLSVTVPVELFPPTTEVGLLVSRGEGGSIDGERRGPWSLRRRPRWRLKCSRMTGVVVIVKVALVAPAAIVTLGGTCAAAVLLLCKVTTAPPVGAARVKVTVPVELLPPTTDVGLNVSEDKDAGAVTVSVALWLPPSVPVITDDVLLATALVVTTNVADVLPAATVTEDGTCAAAVLLLCRVTTAPPVGAAPFSVTVPVELFPPTTEVGFSERADRVAALTVSVATWLAPYNPEMLTGVLAATELVVTVNVAVVLPAATVTLAGTCAAEVLLLASAMAAPPDGAAPLNVTVPVDELPPTTVPGLSVTEESAGGFTVSAADWVVP